MPVAIAERAGDRQRHRDRAEVERHDRGCRSGAQPELGHDPRQRDGEHRRVQGDEDRARGDAQQRRRASPAASHAPRARTPAVTAGARCRARRRSPHRDRRGSVGRVARPDDRRQAELAGDDRRVGQDAAGIGHKAARDREHRDPRRVRGRADDDVARLDRARSRRAASTTRAGPGRHRPRRPSRAARQRRPTRSGRRRSGPPSVARSARADDPRRHDRLAAGRTARLRATTPGHGDRRGRR